MDTSLIINIVLWGISIIIAAIFYFFGIKKMGPKYFVANTSILAKSTGENSNLKILWNDKEVKNINKKQIAFYNSGKIPIRRSDISSDIPISIKCPSSITLLGSYVSKTNRDIKMETVNYEENKIVELKLINDEAFERNDGFVVDILYTSENDIDDKEWSMEGRIISVPRGIRKINTKNFHKFDRLFLLLWSFLAVLFFIFILNVPISHGINTIITYLSFIISISVLGAVILVAWKIFLNIPFWLKQQYWKFLNNI